MEATEGIFEKIRPPRIEDAGLEDCALPPESIKEAFLKAASAVRSSLLSDEDDDESTCVHDPWLSSGDSSDAIVGITPENESPGGCAGKKGGEVPERLGDKVVEGLSVDDVAKGDEVVGGGGVSEEGECCVGELKGLKIGEKTEKKHDCNESDRPILTEGYA